MKRLFVRTFGFGMGIYVGLCLALYSIQRSLLYFPTKGEPSDTHSSQRLDVQDASLRLSVRPLDSSKALIYFGGNAEDVSYALDDYADGFPEHAIYMMHYRGFSGSTGSPSETLIHGDAQSLFDTVYAKHPEVIVVGRSLGSGVAVQLASNNPVKRLILICPYDSILNVARQKLPWLPVVLLLEDRFEAFRAAPKVTSPTLIVAAAQDQVIPMENTKKLYKAFMPVVTMRVLDDVDHETVSQSPNFMRVLQSGR